MVKIQTFILIKQAVLTFAQLFCLKGCSLDLKEKLLNIIMSTQHVDR